MDRGFGAKILRSAGEGQTGEQRSGEEGLSDAALGDGEQGVFSQRSAQLEGKGCIDPKPARVTSRRARLLQGLHTRREKPDAQTP